MATPTAVVPLPISDKIATPRDWLKNPSRGQKDPREGLITDPWVKALTSLTQTISAAATQIALVQLSAQAATIVATPFDIGVTQAGLYRITFYATVTTASSVSSSLTVGLTWTDGGQTKSFSFPAMTGNTTATASSGTATIQSDQSSPIQYSATYASVGVPPMQYTLAFTVERIA